MHPSAFPFLGFCFQEGYYFDKCMPMGCSVSCAYFEMFSTFLQWVLVQSSGLSTVVHYLDEFLFVGAAQSGECQELLSAFVRLAREFGVPRAVDRF